MTSVYPNYSFGNYNNYNQAHRPQNEDDNTMKLAIGAAGLGAASAAIQGLSRVLADKLMQGEEFTTFDNVQKVANGMLEKHNLQKEIAVQYLDKNNVDQFIRQNPSTAPLAGALHTVAEGKNAFYSDELKLAVAPESKPSLMLHELGHSINANRSKFMKILQKTRGWATYAPTALIALSTLFKTKNNENEKTNIIKDNAGILGFAAFLPTIIEEGVASLRGIKAAGKLPNVNLKPLKRNYALAWGTYVLAGVGLGLASKMAVLEQNN